MTDLPDRMVEAGARALWEMGCYPRQWQWEALPEQKKMLWRDEARAVLRAALALAEAEGGAILTVVPKARMEVAEESAIPWWDGWNCAVFDALAGKVTP